MKKTICCAGLVFLASCVGLQDGAANYPELVVTITEIPSKDDILDGRRIARAGTHSSTHRVSSDPDIIQIVDPMPFMARSCQAKDQCAVGIVTNRAVFKATVLEDGSLRIDGEFSSEVSRVSQKVWETHGSRFSKKIATPSDAPFLGSKSRSVPINAVIKSGSTHSIEGFYDSKILIKNEGVDFPS